MYRNFVLTEGLALKVSVINKLKMASLVILFAAASGNVANANNVPNALPLMPYGNSLLTSNVVHDKTAIVSNVFYSYENPSPPNLYIYDSA